MIRHGDYPTATWNLWDMPHRGRMLLGDEQENPIVNKCYVYYEATRDYFVKDQDHPTFRKTFDWIRGYPRYGVNHYYGLVRLSDGLIMNLNPPARDGYAVDWPIRYKDLEPLVYLC